MKNGLLFIAILWNQETVAVFQIPLFMATVEIITRLLML